MLILDFFAKYLPFTKRGYLWNNVPLYLWGITNVLWLICWCSFWLIVLSLIISLVPLSLAILGSMVAWCILRYIGYALLYTLIIGFIYPDGTALSKIRMFWTTQNKHCINFWNWLLKEDN